MTVSAVAGAASYLVGETVMIPVVPTWRVRIIVPPVSLVVMDVIAVMIPHYYDPLLSDCGCSRSSPHSYC